MDKKIIDILLFIAITVFVIGACVFLVLSILQETSDSSNLMYGFLCLLFANVFKFIKIRRNKKRKL
ncbi:hypothetical protein [Intestinibacter sp.]